MPAARVPKTPRLAATPQMSREQQGLQECVEAADLPGAKAILEAQPPGTQRAWVNFPQVTKHPNTPHPAAWHTAEWKNSPSGKQSGCL